MRRFLRIIIALVILAAPVKGMAQDINEELEVLKKRIGELEASVDDVRGLGNQTAINGYFSLEYKDTDQKNKHNSFRVHAFNFFFGKQIGKYRFFSETEFEDAPEFEAAGKASSAGGIVLDKGKGKIVLENAWSEYNHNDLLNIRLGLMLVPTYWRINHYPSIMLSTEKPLIDGTIFPSGIVGIHMYGSVYGGEGGVSYNVYTGNGKSDNDGKTDDNKNKAVGGKLTLHVPTFGLLDYLDIAGHVYTDKPADEDRDRVFGGELLLERYPFALVSEFAKADVDEKKGFYVQPSVSVLPNVILFYRLEDIGDAGGDDTSRNIAGLVYRPIPDVSLKLEYFRTKPDGGEAVNGQNAAFVLFF